MRQMLMALATVVLMFPPISVYAQSGAELAKSKNCMTCHDLDKKKIGPSFKEIAAKKPDEAKAIAALKEGKGHPTKAVATDAELKTLVQYVLSQK